MWTRPSQLVLHIAIVVAATLSVGACATQPRRTPAECAADDATAVKVEQALLGDPQIYARHINVDAERGVVRLSGFVWSGEDFFEAKRVAATVPGVTGVISELEMMVGGRTGAR
jgi:osmotically-inducible protein OsmY